jgi:hypothetical protein
MSTGSTRVWVLTTVSLLFLSVGSGFAMRHQQSHLHVALQTLQTARLQLSKAEPESGGHRARALKLVNQAIEEVKAGLAEHKQPRPSSNG